MTPVLLLGTDHQHELQHTGNAQATDRLLLKTYSRLSTELGCVNHTSEVFWPPRCSSLLRTHPEVKNSVQGKKRLLEGEHTL